MVNHGAYCEVLGRDDDDNAEGGWIRRGMDLIQKGVQEKDDGDDPHSYMHSSGRRRGRSGSVHDEPKNGGTAKPDPSTTMNLRCPVALDEMVKAKAKQDEEDLKGPASGLARMLKTFADETNATATAEASASTTTKDPANRRSSLASWKQNSDDRSLSSSFDQRLSVTGGSNSHRSSILSVGSTFSNNLDSSTSSMNASGGIGAGVKRLSSAALNMLGTSPKDVLSSMMTERRRRSSGTASLDAESDDEEADNHDNTTNNGNPLEPNTKPPPRVSSIGKLLNGLWNEIINEEDTDDDEDNNDNFKKSSHTTATVATSEDDDRNSNGGNGEEDRATRWAEPLLAGIDHLDNEQYTEAIPHFNDVLLLQREVLGTDHLAVAETLNYIGAALTHVDDSYAAMVALKEALWIREHHLEEDHEDVLATRRNLLRLYARSEEGLANARVDSSGQITASASKDKTEIINNNDEQSFVVGDDDDDEPLCF